ncbi:MAG: hypothetical protein J6X44_00070 [Thermoguttaceae bacterium]|nr:hypothetical protein [Thermoguttaceae bacterium]
MHIDMQVIVFLFALVLAFMFIVIYDLYEKMRECETTIKSLQTTVDDGKLIAAILNERLQTASEKIERPQQKKPSTLLWSPYTRIEMAPVPDKRTRRNNKRHNIKKNSKRRNKRS